jgi:uncharacterized cupin superfamily protein
MAVPEARMERSEAGLMANTEGWFVVNLRDAAWVSGGYFADACVIEGEAVPFGQIGYTIAVMRPGQASALYHREGNQEDFLVLAGECIAIIEGEERPLKTWDFVHCPPGTEHIFVGAGDGPCVVFMAGARGGPTDDDLYVRNEVALRHGAGVETDTPSSQVAYAPFERWKPGPPPDVDELLPDG